MERMQNLIWLKVLHLPVIAVLLACFPRKKKSDFSQVSNIGDNLPYVFFNF